MRKGITIAGNLIVDVLYPITGWPRRPGELVTVLDGIENTTGGLVCNTILDLAALDPSLPLKAVGIMGEDAEGDTILKALGEHDNIDASLIRRDGKTSFTMVMSDVSTKERTFFQFRGSNASFDERAIDWDRIDSEFFHIGYILLLDALDAEDAEYGTKMARLLCHAQQKGLKTSIDVVSEAGDRFRRVVQPSLKYTDYCVINELEAEQSTGIPLRAEDGGLIRENLPRALAELKKLGVSTWAVVHCPEGGFGLDETDRYCEVPSLKLPEGYIKGTVGAGDAFCAGILCAAERKMPLPDALKLAVASAACSLSEPGASSGMRSMAEAMGLYERLR